MKNRLILVLFCLFSFQVYSQDTAGPAAGQDSVEATGAEAVNRDSSLSDRSWGDAELQSVTNPVPPDPVPTETPAPADSGVADPGTASANSASADPVSKPAAASIVPPQKPAEPSSSSAPATPAAAKTAGTDPGKLSPEEAQRLETIRYGTETEIAALIQNLKNENDSYLDTELISVAQNTRNRTILSGVFSFFGDRDKPGLEDRALRAIKERDDEANETVLAAVAYLGKIRLSRAVSAIQGLLNSEEQRFTSVCIKSLGLIGRSMPAGTPRKQQNDSVAEDQEAGETAVIAAGEGDESLAPAGRSVAKGGENAAEVAEYLIDFYNNRIAGDESRRELIIALGEVGSPSGVPLLREIAENGDERAVLRMSALESLAKIGDGDGLNAVLMSVESADPNVRSSAVAALGPFSGPKVDEAILEAFRDSFYKTRMAAIQAARDRLFIEAVPYLKYRAERDDVPAVKDEAIKALGAIGNPESMDIVASLFSERKNTDRVRLLSAEMLLKNNANAHAGKVIEELDEAKRKNLTSLYNGFLRVLSPAKAPVLEDLAKRFFFSGGVVEKSYALDMVANNGFRSLADQVRELTDEKNGSLSRKAKDTLEKLGLGE